MKVDIVNQNYQNGLGIRKRTADKTTSMQKAAYLSASPSFNGKKLTSIQNEFLKLFPKKEKWLFEKLVKVADFINGEMGGIVITAIGTGLVAPLPIAFNPFTKAPANATAEEKEEVRKTKKYSAWRQPVSAGLALLLQPTVLKPIDKMLNALTNDKENAKFFKSSVINQTSLNDEGYIKTHQVKDKLKQIDWHTVQVEESKGVFRNAISKEEAIDQLTKEEVNRQIDELVKKLKSNGTISMGKFQIPNSEVAQVVNDNIDNYIKVAQTMKRSQNKITKYTIRGEELAKNEKEIRAILDPEIINALPRSAKNNKKADPDELLKYLKQQYENAKNSEIQNILDEIIKECPEVRESKCARTLDRINFVKKACGGNFDMEKYYRYLVDQNDILDGKIREFKELKIKDLDKATPEQIKEVINNLIKKCHYDINDTKLHLVFADSGVFETNGKDLPNKVFKDIIKTYKDYVKPKFTIFKQLSKACVGVFITLPLTCTALNYIYPRFMELFFPELAGIKKSGSTTNKGGDK